jgi:hypothetical protein
MPNEFYKYVQVRLPLPLFEEFFRAFPGKGERSQILTEMISLVVENKRKRKQFSKDILAEMERRQIL